MDGEQIHVAGEGAVSGYLGAYIDADAMRVNPLVAVVITIMLFIAFRSLRGALLPNFVVLGTVASALGLMAAFGVSFFVITNGLLPVLIGIAVADSIHIFSQYYEENEARIRVFQKDEPIVTADATINRLLDGVHYLDIMIETAEAEALFKPENLSRIETLQTYLETLPNVGGVTSIVDYLKQMNRALNEGEKSAYRLPGSAELAAQYFLLYSVSGDPTDFQEEVDYDYRLANVRVSMNSGKYTDEKVVVEAAQAYIEEQFNAPGISAHLSGRVNVDYHWIKRLGETNWGSVAIALLLVWLMASISLRSLVAGAITVLPVTLTVLLVYAVMAFTGIWLSISTSMFAAIAIGLGVDFAVHTIERLEVLLRDEQRSLDDSIAHLYPSTGRALLFNFLALVLGFGMLTTSEVVVLQEFGSIVALAIAASFIASMTLLPAIAKLFKPRFLGFAKANSSNRVQTESTQP